MPDRRWWSMPCSDDGSTAAPSLLLTHTCRALNSPPRPPRTPQVRLMITADPHFFWWLLTNSCLAYAVNLTNFLVTKFTSALTLQVGGRCGLWFQSAGAANALIPMCRC